MVMNSAVMKKGTIGAGKRGFRIKDLYSEVPGIYSRCRLDLEIQGNSLQENKYT